MVSFNEAAYLILQENGRPMSAEEITTIALERGLVVTRGATPAKTLAAILYTDIKNNGSRSRFVQVGRGPNFALNDSQSDITSPVTHNDLQTNEQVNDTTVMDVLTSKRWSIVERLSIDSRPARFESSNDLLLSDSSTKFLGAAFLNGIYQHQKEAIRHFLTGEHVCLATGTASGKSLVFQLAALEILAKSPESKIMAIYPMKALGREQEERWEGVLAKSCVAAKVGRIDGNVPVYERLRILHESQVLVFTPDIIHAWLFSNLSNGKVLDFISKIALIVVDEVHTYTGVFGSNAAFLFRRLQHVMDLLGAHPQYICASATISDPEKHLQKLLGLEFRLIGRELDSSPKYQSDIHLVNPPGKTDFITEIVDLLQELRGQTKSRFIAFVDSRKQVELISSVLARYEEDDKDNKVEKVDSEDPEIMNDTGFLEKLNVLPYRAGYEEEDRSKIQERLAQGTLSGVVSTSALELGIDIPYLNVCVLVGVPSSFTSLQQRIGRIGRHSKGDVIVVNSGDVYDKAVFANPKNFLQRPLAESTLYLENDRIQYIHALCLARIGGEHDQVASHLNMSTEADFSSSVIWPQKFFELCRKERAGEISREIQSIKLEAGDSPNHAFPLRDVESQFKVGCKRGPDIDSLGSLSYAQLMREAYPGAVYYYATQPYRVIRVNTKVRTIDVRREKRYTTKPQRLPTMVFPSLIDGSVFASYKQSDLVSIECSLQVRESINGLKERRGPTELSYNYPLSQEYGFYFDQQFFTRNYFTTGVVITHPVLNKERVECLSLAELIYETFLLKIPFERQDINFAVDKFRVNRKPVVQQGSRFIALYDQTYGSLRLSGRLMEPGILNQTLREARALADTQETLILNSETLAALDTLVEATAYKQASISFGSDVAGTAQADSSTRVILADSKGLIASRCEEFLVKRTFFAPDGLSYEGQTLSQIGKHETTIMLVQMVLEIPGVSKIGYYNYRTGQVEEAEESDAVQGIKPPEFVWKSLTPDLEKLVSIISSYFDENKIRSLCNETGVDYDSLAGGDKSERTRELIVHCDSLGLVATFAQRALTVLKQR